MCDRYWGGGSFCPSPLPIREQPRKNLSRIRLIQKIHWKVIALDYHFDYHKKSQVYNLQISQERVSSAIVLLWILQTYQNNFLIIRCHLLPLIVICCYSLTFIVVGCHSISPWNSRCHSFSLVITLSLVHLFINNLLSVLYDIAFSRKYALSIKTIHLHV